MSKEKKLYRVSGVLRISHYMSNVEYEDFDVFVEAENMGLAQILVHQHYEEESQDYCVNYSVDINSVSLAVISGEVQSKYLEQYAHLLN